jgi:hypothetical protein
VDLLMVVLPFLLPSPMTTVKLFVTQSHKFVKILAEATLIVLELTA